MCHRTAVVLLCDTCLSHLRVFSNLACFFLSLLLVAYFSPFTSHAFRAAILSCCKVKENISHVYLHHHVELTQPSRFFCICIRETDDDLCRTSLPPIIFLCALMFVNFVLLIMLLLFDLPAYGGVVCRNICTTVMIASCVSSFTFSSCVCVYRRPGRKWGARQEWLAFICTGFAGSSWCQGSTGPRRIRRSAE